MKFETKYDIGQEVYGIVPKSVWTEFGYTIHFKIKAFIPDNNGVVLMLEDDITNIHYAYEHQVFPSLKEAEQKLKEMQ